MTTPGVLCRLDAEEWLLDAVPPSPVDYLPAPKPRLPGADELDYALLRLASPPEGPPRQGLEPVALSVAMDAPLFLVGHPDTPPRTQRLSLDTRAVLGTNENQTRLRYRTNTLGGSSGSPCFTADWKLVALHHSHDPARPPTYNEGVPFSAILPALDRRGTAKWLKPEATPHSPATSTRRRSRKKS